MDAEKTIRTGKACKIMGVTIKVLFTMIHAEQIPYVKAGTQYRFYASQLENFKKQYLTLP